MYILMYIYIYIVARFKDASNSIKLVAALRCTILNSTPSKLPAEWFQSFEAAPS